MAVHRAGCYRSAQVDGVIGHRLVTLEYERRLLRRGGGRATAVATRALAQQHLAVHVNHEARALIRRGNGTYADPWRTPQRTSRKRRSLRFWASLSRVTAALGCPCARERRHTMCWSKYEREQ